MAIELPGPVAAYFKADEGGDTSQLARCFTPDAVVKDEGHTYAGRDAIQNWKAEAGKKFTYTCEPIKLETVDDRSVVTGHLVGDFPGSPIDLRFIFKLQGDEIAELEIIP